MCSFCKRLLPAPIYACGPSLHHKVNKDMVDEDKMGRVWGALKQLTMGVSQMVCHWTALFEVFLLSLRVQANDFRGAVPLSQRT